MIPSAATRLKRSDNNMDAVRYVLAGVVLVSHFNYLCGFDVPMFMGVDSAVGCFFALSGFLVYGSHKKYRSLRRFFGARARRILPQYLFIVGVCALTLWGVSSLTPAEYFADSGLYKYIIANCAFLNWLHPELPGVFEGQQFVSSAVNGSLWTLKVEWALYASVPAVLWMCTLAGRRGVRAGELKVIGSIIIVSVLYKLLFFYLYTRSGQGIYEILGRQFLGQLDYFYCGVLLYLYFPVFLRLRPYLCAAALLLIIFSDFIPYYGLTLKAPAETIVLFTVCMTGRWGHFLSRHDNVSYDMYLFHYPIIQIGVWAGISALPAIPALLITVAATAALSFASWNLIGKRFQRK